MKKLTLLISLLLVLSCATKREKNLDTSTVENKTDLDLTKNGESDVNLKTRTSDYSVSDLSKTKISVIPSGKCTNDSKTSNPNAPGKTLKVKDSKGNSMEIPVNDDSEIRIEQESETQEKLNKAESELANRTKENINLKATIFELEQKKKLEVKSERSEYWLKVLLILIGMLIAFALMFLWKRLKQSQWYLSILKYFTKNDN